MRTYEVTMTLCRQRVVRVEAPSKSEALAKAQGGYGELVSNPRAPLRLLTAEAKALA